MEESTVEPTTSGCNVRHTFSAEDIVVLEQVYAAGMTSTGVQMMPQIESIAEQLAATVDCIKTWIRNRNRKARKRPASIDEAGLQGKCLSPFQIYTKMFYREGIQNLSTGSLAEKNREVGSSWRSAPNEIRQKCISLSESSKCSDPAAMTVETRRSLILKKMNQINVLCNDLEGLGCAAACVTQGDPEDHLHVVRMANGLARDFEPHLSTKLIVYLDNQRTGNGRSAWTNASVKELFEDRWVKSGGKGKPNYAASGTAYDVIGLPVGIPFHRWQDYGRKQVERIMERKDIVKFIFKNNGDEANTLK